jgi:hypothetical protein
MMDCKQINELLLDYLYQELEPPQKETFEAHLRSCSHCSKELVAYEKTRTLMGDLVEEEPPPRLTPLLVEEAARAVQQRRPGFLERFFESLRLALRHPAMTAAVTLLVVLGISFYVYRQSPLPSERRVRSPLPIESDRPSPARSPTVVASQGIKEEAAPAASQREPSAEDQVAMKPMGSSGGAIEGKGSGATGGLVSPSLAGKVSADEKKRDGAGYAAERLARSASAKLKKLLSSDAPAPRPVRVALAPAPNKEAALAAAVEPPSDDLLKAKEADKDLPRGSAEKNNGLSKSTQPPPTHAGPTVGVYGKARPEQRAEEQAPKPVAQKTETEQARHKTKSPPPSAKAPQATRAQAASGQKTAEGSASVPSQTAEKNLASRDDVSSRKQPAEGRRQARGDVKKAKALLAQADKASAAGRCAEALKYYNEVLQESPDLSSTVAARIRPCTATLARTDEGQLVKAQQAYPLLSRMIAPELEQARQLRQKKGQAGSEKPSPPRAKPATSPASK